MGNVINTVLCDREELPKIKNENMEPGFDPPIQMRYPVYYRGFHRPFIH